MKYMLFRQEVHNLYGLIVSLPFHFVNPLPYFFCGTAGNHNQCKGKNEPFFHVIPRGVVIPGIARKAREFMIHPYVFQGKGDI